MPLSLPIIFAAVFDFAVVYHLDNHGGRQPSRMNVECLGRQRSRMNGSISLAKRLGSGAVSSLRKKAEPTDCMPKAATAHG